MCRQYSDIYASTEMRFILCCVKAVTVSWMFDVGCC